MILNRYFKIWRNNPHSSFSCCLALLLPLNDLKGEIHGLDGNNVIDNQLVTGEIETLTVVGAVKASGVIDVTLGRGEQGDGETVVIQKDNCQDSEHKDNKCHKQIQTELFPLSYADRNL